MRVLSNSECLTLWEQGVRWHPLDRCLLVLSFVHGERAADWPVGRRNHALLELHHAWFSPRLEGWAACPQCGEKAEFDLDVRELLAVIAEPQQHVVMGEQRFRLPTSSDLAKAASAGDGRQAAVELLKLCLVDSQAPSAWSEELIEKAGESLAAADPLAETQVVLSCPVCEHRWNDAVEIGSFLWAELEARARRLMWEVHSLASAYGWTEAETLALSVPRRASYVELACA